MKLIKGSTFLLPIVALFLFNSCGTEIQKEAKADKILEEGIWRMEIFLNKEILPVNFNLSQKDGKWDLEMLNAKEKISLEDLVITKDSLIAQLPVFDSEFRLSISDSKHLSGTWNNYYYASEYSLEVKAEHGNTNRFIDNGEQKSSTSLGNKYEVVFGPGTEGESNALGLFEQKDNHITGTFATEKGDYRHLEGSIFGDSLYLSTFDGSHAFLFKAEKRGDSLFGLFYSGKHYQESWTAVINSEFQLRNPDSLTFIEDEEEKISFKLINSSGDSISLSDDKYKNKLVIIQIMGSWCPNCLDETTYFTELYNRYNKDGLEVIAVAFERARTKEKSINNLRRLKERTGAPYEMLLGGASRDDKAIDVFPMLNHIMSYPTAIFIDKAGSIRKIHTGFYGPGTGELYEEFTKETEAFIENLLSE